jgi:hypothetical protein
VKRGTGRRPTAFEHARCAAEGKRRRQGVQRWAPRGEHEKGGSVLTSGGQRGWRSNDRQRRAQAARCVRTVGRCRVADERGPAGSGSGRAERGMRRVGRPGNETGWAEPG